MAENEISAVIQLLSKLPGLGPRSARRAALYLLHRRETVLAQLSTALALAAEKVRACAECGNLDTSDPCGICRDEKRDRSKICVVEQIADLWALERAGVFSGQYHVLGGTLSALDGVGPDQLKIDKLVARATAPESREVILATSATVDGSMTAHYIADRLAGLKVTVTRLAHGVPIGGELEYLDDGTLSAALKARRPS